MVDWKRCESHRQTWVEQRQRIIHNRLRSQDFADAEHELRTASFQFEISISVDERRREPDGEKIHMAPKRLDEINWIWSHILHTI